MDQQALATRQFGVTATDYLTSTVHASGADLDRLASLPQRSPDASVLDVGCGAGHASFALARGGVSRVVAYDLSSQMLDVVATEAARRGHSSVETHVGPAESLPFADASFDCVVSRYSAHHWFNVRAALLQMHRVLKPGGTLIIIDVLAPESPLLDTVLQTVEILRDLSHVRNYRESEWRALLEGSGLSCSVVDRWKLRMEFQSWVARIRTPAARVEALHTVFDALPAQAREYFAVGEDDSFTIDAAWYQATKR